MRDRMIRTATIRYEAWGAYEVSVPDDAPDEIDFAAVESDLSRIASADAVTILGIELDERED